MLGALKSSDGSDTSALIVFYSTGSFAGSDFIVSLEPSYIYYGLNATFYSSFFMSSFILDSASCLTSGSSSKISKSESSSSEAPPSLFFGRFE